jgi:DNA mismatch repair protein MutL
MARIRQLSATLVNQIAAGEVVERPASVVKELLENAIDAGSTRIDVEVAHGGKALASIASIAQISLQSRPADQPSGAAITCKGGELSAVQPWNGAPGTRIEVRHLFYNTPARRKFLKGVGTEMGQQAWLQPRRTS